MERKAYLRILQSHPRRILVGYIYRHLVVDIAIWLVAIGLASGPWWGKVGAALLFAVFTFRSFSMMHECVHSAAFIARRSNAWVGEIYGVFCWLPFRKWQRLHLEHHTWTGNVDRDPSMKILARFRDQGFRVPRVVSECWRLWIPLLGFLQHRVFWQGTLVQREFAFVAGLSIYLLGAVWLLGPVVIGGGALIYLYMVEIVNFPHHLGVAQFGGEARFAASEQYRFSRSCHYPRWVAHHIFLNFNLHTEHHLFPAHPWYQLDALHRELASIGLDANRCVSNEWILRNRSQAIEVVFGKTFASGQSKEKQKTA